MTMPAGNKHFRTTTAHGKQTGQLISRERTQRPFAKATVRSVNRESCASEGARILAKRLSCNPQSGSIGGNDDGRYEDESCDETIGRACVRYLCADRPLRELQSWVAENV
jgi:hypothetical protein